MKKLLLNLSSIDGALIIDTNGSCHAVGVILDGITKEKCNMARGGEERSSCLRIGTFWVIRKIVEDYNLPQMISRYLEARDAGLFFDFAAYSIVVEGNAAQYYPGYACCLSMLGEVRNIYRLCI